MTTVLFQIVAVALTAIFVYFGMDVRRRHGAGDFVSVAWQTLMKLLSFMLIGAFVGITLLLSQVMAADWLALAVIASGTAFIAAAKRSLGSVHTFTGQYLEKPGLVTQGVYATTRNPLYFGVLQCELGASMLIVLKAPLLWPESHPYWLGALGAALLYALSFNWIMAVHEARRLERHFGEQYRRYRADVPFLFPLIRLRKEARR